jgi:DNA polymerase III epsilon subunit family exonuclease
MYIALDLETTGLNAKKDKIIEVAAIKIDLDGNILDEYYSLVQPHLKLPEIIIHLTGITDDELVGAPTIEEIKDDLANFIGGLPVLGHSIQFDLNFLNANGIETNPLFLDTFELAQTLLPNEASYSLEVMSEKYQLPHSNKHRADDDTRVCIELYKMLIERMKSISGKSNQTIREILNKSDWGWKESFLKFSGLNPSNDPQIKSPTENLPKESPKLQNKLQETFISNENVIIESHHGSVNDLAKILIQTQRPTILSTPTPSTLPSSEYLAHLQHPGRYICESRLKDFLNKTSFSNDDSRLLIKVILWLENTQTGEKNEIIVGKKEENSWHHISAISHLFEQNCKNCFYTQAFRKAESIPLVVIHPHLLVENIVRKGKFLPTKKHLAIDSIETFEQIAAKTLTQWFSLNNLLAETSALENDEVNAAFEIFFGLMGIFIEKNADHNAFASQIVLNQTHSDTPEWKNLIASLQNINERLNALPSSTSQTLLLSKFNALKKSLSLNPAVLSWMMVSFEGDPLLKACPVEIARLLKQEIWSKATSITGLSHYGQLEESFQFLKKRLQLPKEMNEISLAKQETEQTDKVPFKLHADLPHTKSPQNLQKTVERILSLDLKTDAFLIVNSVKSIQQVHERLEKPFKDQEILLLSQGMTGGMGKITQRFIKTPQQTLIIGTERLFEIMLANEAAKKIKTLLIHRLPFLPPSHPVHEYENKQLNDGFREYSLPRATLRLKKFLYLFLTKCTPQMIHALDPRFENYDRYFMKSLPEEMIMA